MNGFRAHLNMGRLGVKHLLKCLMVSNTVPVNRIMDVVTVMTSASTKSLKLTIFASVPDPIHQEIGTEQVYLFLREFLALATYAEKAPRVREFLYTIHCSGQRPVDLIDVGWFLQTVLNFARQGVLDTMGITTPSVLKPKMFYHIVDMVKKTIPSKTLMSFR